MTSPGSSLTLVALALAGCGFSQADVTGPATTGDKAQALRGVQRARFDSGSSYLVVELLDDDLAHFELSAVGPAPDVSSPVYTTPMVAKRDYPGPQVFERSGNVLRTAELELEVDATSLCVSVTDLIRAARATRICPKDLAQDWKGLTLSKESTRDVYGLGEQFLVPGSAFGNWMGQVRSPGGVDGNAMVDFNGGANGNAQFPIMYALGDGTQSYALFLDQVYKQQWDFTADPFVVQMWGDQIRFYVMSGPDLRDLRSDYLELVGHAPVPPKRAFGIWVSEYGFDDWAELDGKLADLRGASFPVDGFALDLQWFGGVNSNSDDSNMGTLRFDPVKFADPAQKIAQLRDEGGVGLMPIEESYVSRGLPEHADLAGRGYLARDSVDGPPTYITGNPWWGKGGMLDWTNPEAGDYWHDTKRQALIDLGVVGHWTDLGEPEMYNGWAVYRGFPELGKFHHADIHNVYALDWIASIARGYQRHGLQQRPFMLSRSGTSGIQRYGAAMWSADIGSDLSSLATHAHAQMHMSLSGIDYFGADIGGFHREALKSDLNEAFTQWFANGMLFDVPGRSHTENLCNCKETSPARIGDFASNLDNARQRYRLSPYVYSVAHRAWRDGEAVFPPLVYSFQDDLNVRDNAHEKMIGPSLLGAIVAGAGETQRGVYLPAGDWVDFHSNDWVSSSGQWLDGVPEYRDGRFTLPLFARAGAIIPQMPVDEGSQNILGKRSDGTQRTELFARVFASPASSQFTLLEDDGQTIAYQSGAVRETTLHQALSGSSETVSVDAALGTYDGAPDSRAVVIELVVHGAMGTGVSADGNPLPQLQSQAALDSAAEGWVNAGRNLVVAKARSLPVSTARQLVFSLAPIPPDASAAFVCSNVQVQAGQGVYLLGDAPQLGSWSSDRALRMFPTASGKWTRTISGLPLSSRVEWKCVVRSDAGGAVLRWQPGANSAFNTAADGFSGTTSGAF
jgi:alpha-glucosidase (family GH31 glycosyl hydrolase)